MALTPKYSTPPNGPPRRGSLEITVVISRAVLGDVIALSASTKPESDGVSATAGVLAELLPGW